MCGDRVLGVPVVLLELDPHALAACDLVPLHSPQQLGALTREHRAYDKLDAALEFRQSRMLLAVTRVMVIIVLLLLSLLVIGW